MIFTHAEIDVLRLSAWCKDLPKNTKNIPAETIALLCRLGLLRQSRCGLSCRTTPEGYKVLQKAGFDYEPDKQYRGRGSVLTRRLETAEITGFFWRFGADVFRDTPDTEKSGLVFLPSFALRRKNYANVLGGTRLTGFLYSGDTTFIPYYITPESEGVYANVERRTFRAESLLCGKNPFVLYTGTGEMEQLIETVTAKEDFLIGIDCNVARFVNAITQTTKRLHIVLLSSQASRRSWRINQTAPKVEVYMFYYDHTMQQRALRLMASKLSAATVIESNISEEGLAAMSDCEDLTTQLAKELVSGLKENTEDLADSFRKMALLGNRKDKTQTPPVTPILDVPERETEQAKPNTAMIPMAEQFHTFIKKTRGNTADTGQLSIFDLLAS